MLASHKLLLKVATLNCLIIGITCYVGGANSWQIGRQPNVTNSYNPWLQQPKAPMAAPTTRAPVYANNNNNNWHQQQNPWMNRNPVYNQTKPTNNWNNPQNNYPQNNWQQQQNPWINRNPTYNQTNPYNNWNNPQNSGSLSQRSSFNATRQHGVVVQPTPSSNSYPNWNSAGQNNWQNPAQRPPYFSPTPASNSPGSSQSNWHNQSPGTVLLPRNQTFGSLPINNPAAPNPWQHSSQPSAPAATYNGGSIWGGYQGNGGNSATAPLAPIGGFSNPAMTSNSNVPLAPIGGPGAAQWNSGSPAGLSYPMGQAQSPNRPIDPAHPYAHLFVH